MANTDKRAGWDRMPGLHEINNGKGKTYKNLVRFERPCATCKEPFGIYVTQTTADGEGHNSSFGLRNCEKHRMKMVPAGDSMSGAEVEKLRTANATMKSELEGLYARNGELYTENQALKSRLAAYELSPEIASTQRITAWTVPGETMKTPDPVGEKLRQEWVKNNSEKSQKMPWQG